MKKNIENLCRKYYPVKTDPFRDCILRYLRNGDIIVDAGCGNGSQYKYDLKNMAKEIIGVDTCDDIEQNDNVTRRLKNSIDNISLSDESVDIIISRYVFEHIKEPEKVLKEFKRILKPDGKIILTPNRFNYVYLISSMTPQSFHLWVNKIRTDDTMAEKDTFPTYYKLNYGKAIKTNAFKAGLEVKETIFFEPKPAYLIFTPWLFRLGVFYERVVNKVSAFSSLRGIIVGVLVKV